MEYTRTPTIEIRNKLTDAYGVQLLVKLEYLNHSHVSGNKYWKLKFNIAEALKQGKKKIVTFGGAYSNHIYATAAYAKACNIDSVGIIRGEKILPLNSTLQFAEACGMQLHFISREKYRAKTDSVFHRELHEIFGEFYLIPEGGTNELAVKGCEEFGRNEVSDVAFDYLCLAVGTGGTMAGLICAFDDQKAVIGIPVLKNGEFLEGDIKEMVASFSGKDFTNWRLLTSYHHGGYAKVTEELQNFIMKMYGEHNLPLDHVYNGKMLWAVIREIELGSFRRGSTILALHTGGLQGSAFKREA
jgi:1-aminocyclopropane-1-carboxylate deaminase